MQIDQRFFAVSFKPMNEIGSSLTSAGKFLILLPLINKGLLFILSGSHTPLATGDKGRQEEADEKR